MNSYEDKKSQDDYALLLAKSKLGYIRIILVCDILTSTQMSHSEKNGAIKVISQMCDRAIDDLTSSNAIPF